MRPRFLYLWGDKGSVLIITLWILFILSFLGLQYSRTRRLEALIVLNQKSDLEEYYRALEALEVSEKLLMYSAIHPVEEEGGENQGEEWLPDGEEHDLPCKVGSIRVSVEDERGKLNLNKASRDQIYQVLTKLGVEDEKASIIADSIEDWRDSDKLSHLNGAEEEYYSALPRPYSPPNGPFKSLGELLLVRGMTYELFWEKPGLFNYFTLYNKGTWREDLAPKSLREALEEESGEEKVTEKDKSRFKLENGVTYRFKVTIDKGERRLVFFWWGEYTGKTFKERRRLIR